MKIPVFMKGARSVAWSGATLISMLPSFVLPTLQAAERGQGTDKIVKETTEAVDATKQYTIEKKETFEKAVQEELRDIQRKIAELQAKTAAASGEARAELQKGIKDLEIKKDEARRAFNDLHDSTASAWNKFKDDMNLALARLRQTYKESVSKLP